jgi:hypothetical protein
MGDQIGSRPFVLKSAAGSTDLPCRAGRLSLTIDADMASLERSEPSTFVDPLGIKADTWTFTCNRHTVSVSIDSLWGNKKNEWE